MIECPSVKKQDVRFHYDLSTLFYRLLWGEHIHHGWWQADESPSEAQVQLAQQLARAAGIAGGERVLDVGCGMGGSSMMLARMHRCRVTGITLSPFQRRWAAATARWRRLQQLTDFICADAESFDWPGQSVDVVWSIECTEHLFDKASFFQRAAEWVRPGGRIAICAWLASDAAEQPGKQQMVYDVCEGFLCPSLGTFDDYRSWMSEAGLTVTTTDDWTPQVTRTWQICMKRVKRTGVGWLAKLIDRDTVRFLERFQTIDRAYQEGAMQYGCIVAEKPLATASCHSNRHGGRSDESIRS